MKITEVTKTNREALFEELDRDNETGVATENLVAIVEAHRADVWEDLTDEYLVNLKKKIDGSNI
jgi:hypothetical protein